MRSVSLARSGHHRQRRRRGSGARCGATRRGSTSSTRIVSAGRIARAAGIGDRRQRAAEQDQTVLDGDVGRQAVDQRLQRPDAAPPALPGTSTQRSPSRISERSTSASARAATSSQGQAARATGLAHICFETDHRVGLDARGRCGRSRPSATSGRSGATSTGSASPELASPSISMASACVSSDARAGSTAAPPTARHADAGQLLDVVLDGGAVAAGPAGDDERAGRDARGVRPSSRAKRQRRSCGKSAQAKTDGSHSASPGNSGQQQQQHEHRRPRRAASR